MSTPRTTPAVLAYAGNAPIVAGAMTTNQAGQPVQAFRKDLIRVGKFTHPATGQPFEITTDWLENAVAQFARMRDAGVRVPVPSGHSFKAEDNRGYVRELFRDGDNLIGVLDMIGDDAIRMAGRNEVSIYAEPEFIDGTGAKYPWAVQHVALTPVPVIPGQDAFRAIAASRDGTTTTNSVPVYRLAAKGIAPMENLMKIAGILGIKAEGMAEGDLWAAVFAAMDGTAKDKAKDAEAIAASRDALKVELDAANAKLAEVTKAPEQPHPQVIKYARAHRVGKIDGLIKDAKITKDAGDALKAMWIGDGLALSRTLGAEDDSRFDTLVSILEKLPQARPTGSVTGPIAASRHVGDENAELHPELEAHRKARREAEAKR